MGKKDSATRNDEGRASVLGDDNPAVRRVGSDRMAAMEALAGQRREAVATESGVEIPAPTAEETRAAQRAADPDAQVDDDSIVDPDAQRREQQEDRREQEEADRAERERAAKARADADAALRRQAASDERTVLDGDLSRYVIKTKVDGVEQEVTLDQAVRTLQKDMAADRRLEEATKLKREAEEALRQARAEGDRKAIREAEERSAQADAGVKKAAEERRAKMKAAADAMFAGDTETFANVMEELSPAGRAEGATHQDIDAVAEVVTARIEQRAALRRFQKDYPEIVASDALAAMADKKVNELVQGGTSFEDALAQAGEHVRGSIKELAAGYGMSEGGRASTGRRVDRQSRKEGIDEPRTAAAAQASGNQQVEAPTPSSVIAEMAAARMPQRRTSSA